MSNILVVGELGLDVFIYGEASRVNPEAPSLVLNPTKIIKNDGMAGNVVNNLRGLNPDNKVHFLYQETIITKTRYCCKNSGYILLRVDEKDKCDRTRGKKISSLADFKSYDVVVVSDYNKGFLLEEDLEYIAKNSKFSIIDTKKKSFKMG